MKHQIQAKPIIKKQNFAKIKAGIKAGNSTLQCAMCCGLATVNPKLIQQCQKSLSNCKC